MVKDARNGINSGHDARQITMPTRMPVRCWLIIAATSPALWFGDGGGKNPATANPITNNTPINGPAQTHAF